MRSTAYIIMVSVFLLACKTQKETVQTADVNEETKLTISFEQVNGSEGKAPEYKLELYSNRQMYLTAVKNFDKNGKYMRTVTEKEFKQILDNFNNAGFFAFNNEYLTDGINGPLKNIYFSYQGKEKRIKYNSAEPNNLNELELLMQSYLDRVGWEKLAW